MSEEIYANVDITADNIADSCDSEPSYEDVDGNEDNLETQRSRSPQKSGNSVSGINTAKKTGYKLAVVCLLLLCVLLLTAVTVLWIKYKNLDARKTQLQTSYNTMTEFLNANLGWNYFNSRIYYISNEEKNQTESRRDCRERGADLVIISSKEEQEFVSGLLRSRKAWIGLNDSAAEGEWKWLDDSSLTTKYWGHGEPNSNAGDEDCAITGEMSDPVFTWADYPCDDKFCWVCEKDLCLNNPHNT